MIQTLFGMIGRRQAPHLSDPEWRELLDFSDRTQLSLYLREIPGLPAWLEPALETRRRDNALRRERLCQALSEVSAALSSANIDFIVLKGFTHPANEARVQYDLDFLVQPQDAAPAREALHRLGYVPHGEYSLSAEHARPLVRPHQWTWRGNYFDPDMPIPVELHDSLWRPTLDRIHATGIEEFWNRRDAARLAEPDLTAFAALHALRHILRHDARPAHVLELGRFLDAPPEFWNRWRELHPARLRALQTVAFRFAFEWFGCAWPDAVAAEWNLQPEPVTAWFREFAWSPAANLLRPNKDTVWLHMALAESSYDRFRIFCDRLAPLRLPRERRFLGRVRYHAGAFAPALANGLRWWWRRATASTAAQISDWKRRSV